MVGRKDFSSLMGGDGSVLIEIREHGSAANDAGGGRAPAIPASVVAATPLAAVSGVCSRPERGVVDGAFSPLRGGGSALVESM